MSEIISRIEKTNTPVYIRHGLGWKGAEWNKTTKENLIAIVKRGNYAHYDICNVKGGLGISFYSANDML